MATDHADTAVRRRRGGWRRSPACVLALRSRPGRSWPGRLRHLDRACSRAAAPSSAGLRPRRRRVHARRSAPTPTTPTPGWRSSGRSCGPSEYHFNRGPPARDGWASFEEALVEYQIASELNPGERRHRRRRCEEARNQLRAKVAVAARGQDRARDADRADARPAAARPRPAAGPEAAGVARLPRGEQPRRLHGARALRRRQRRLRPGLPRRAGHDRPAQRHVRGRAVRARRPRTQQLLPRHRAADDHDHPRHAGQAPRVRGGGRPHVLPEQRRPQGDDRPAADRGRPAAPRADHAPPTRSRSRTRRSASQAAGTPHRGHRQGAARGRHRRRAARGRPHAPARVRAADRVAGLRPAGHQRRGRRQPDGPDAARSAEPDAGGRLPDRPAGARTTAC